MERTTRDWSTPVLFAVVAASAMALVVPAAALQRPASLKLVTRASWYGKHFQGRRTAAGTPFNPKRLTAAHRTLRLGTKVRVTELRTGRSVVVLITDRGPFRRGRGIDLSYAAARRLGIVHRGIARVRLEPLPPEAPRSALPVVTTRQWPATSWLPNAVAE